MKVNELAQFDVKSCGPDTDLASAAQIMWDCDCGIVPVVNEEKKVVGTITDRDICIAAATRGSRPSEIRVRDVISREVATCSVSDDLPDALNVMKRARVHRLPVVDDQERLAGILSLNDIVLRAECRPNAAVSGEAFLDTMKAICAHTRKAAAA